MKIHGVSVVELDHIPDDRVFMLTTNPLDNAIVVEQSFTIANPEVFYKKPKWYQWRLRRKYRRILKTNN